MERDRIRDLLKGVREGELDVDQALESLVHLPFVDTEDSRVDTQRSLRMGIPEVVFGPGKTPDQIAEVVRVLREELRLSEQ